MTKLPLWVVELSGQTGVLSQHSIEHVTIRWTQDALTIYVMLMESSS